MEVPRLRRHGAAEIIEESQMFFLVNTRLWSIAYVHAMPGQEDPHELTVSSCVSFY